MSTDSPAAGSAAGLVTCPECGWGRGRHAADCARYVMLNARVVFWMCPVEGHGEGPPLRETVRWIDGVAHCMEPGCGRTSAIPKEQDQSA